MWYDRLKSCIKNLSWTSGLRFFTREPHRLVSTWWLELLGPNLPKLRISCLVQPACHLFGEAYFSLEKKKFAPRIKMKTVCIINKAGYFVPQSGEKQYKWRAGQLKSQTCGPRENRQGRSDRAMIHTATLS